MTSTGTAAGPLPALRPTRRAPSRVLPLLAAIALAGCGDHTGCAVRTCYLEPPFQQHGG